MIIDNATILGIISILGAVLFLYETRPKRSEDHL